MKRILIAIVVCLLVISAVTTYKAFLYKTRQITTAGVVRRILPTDTAAVLNLSRSLQINTVSYDDTSVVNQQGIDSFFTFLKSTYPSVFNQLDDTIINSKSLLLKWSGKTRNTKPIILYAHLDVVPIESSSIQDWKHGAFSGDLSEGFIWGRGALDDKGSLVSIFEAITRLISKGYKPNRDVYFAFGSDEEIGGQNGAAVIADFLRKQGVRFEFYMDEGGMVSEGIVPNIKRPVALIGTAEKGVMTLELTVNKKGGHSSHPSKESALDILNAAIKKLHDNQEERRTTETVEEFLRFIGPEMPPVLRIVFANEWLFKPLMLNEYEKSDEGRALLRTTQVTTVMNAGMKENVIPSVVSAKVNYRILGDETSKDVIDRAVKLINDTAVHIKAGEIYEASRNSNTSTEGFKLLQKTCGQVFPDAIVAPFLMLGSTDSKHFQDITDNTYRFFPVRMNKETLSTIHGNNERIGVSDFMETISFYETMLENLQ